MTKVAIIGLGNPGAIYENTRHNMGFWLLDRFAEEKNLSFRFNRKFNAEVSKFTYSDNDIILIKPLSFMNDSGKNLSPILRMAGFECSRKILVHDELTLPLGSIKISPLGTGSGGHNGVRSVISALGNTVHRIRLGIGSKETADQTLSNYVLSKFSKEDISYLEKRLPYFFKAVHSSLVSGIDSAMNNFNKLKQPQIIQ